MTAVDAPLGLPEEALNRLADAALDGAEPFPAGGNDLAFTVFGAVLVILGSVGLAVFGTVTVTLGGVELTGRVARR